MLWPFGSSSTWMRRAVCPLDPRRTPAGSKLSILSIVLRVRFSRHTGRHYGERLATQQYFTLIFSRFKFLLNQHCPCVTVCPGNNCNKVYFIVCSILYSDLSCISMLHQRRAVYVVDYIQYLTFLAVLNNAWDTCRKYVSI